MSFATLNLSAVEDIFVEGVYASEGRIREEIDVIFEGVDLGLSRNPAIQIDAYTITEYGTAYVIRKKHNGHDFYSVVRRKESIRKIRSWMS